MTKKNNSTNNTKKNSTAVATASTKTRSTTPNTVIIGRDEIATRAYAIYLSGQGGTEVDHWLQAERELTGTENARV